MEKNIDRNVYTEQDEKGALLGFLCGLFGGVVLSVLIYAILYSAKTPKGRSNFAQGALAAVLLGLIIIFVIVTFTISNTSISFGQ
jgi:hypothetical protein